MKHYLIKNAVDLYWLADDNQESRGFWLSRENATLFTQHGKDTYQLPFGGVWVYVGEF